MQTDQAFDSKVHELIVDIYVKENKSKLNPYDTEIGYDFNVAIKILIKMIDILKEEPCVLEIDTEKQDKDFVIVGDIHGSLESLLAIFGSKGVPPQTRYLFLGDLVDRGKNSCEVIILIYALKYLYNDCVYIIRGNHEFIDMTTNYGFKDECYRRITQTINETKYGGEEFYKKVVKTFKYLPLCAIINEKKLCVHGGISALINNRNELKNLKKVGYQFCSEDSAQAEILWNDPDSQIETYERSPRGIGCVFGEVALFDFLDKMKFDLIIRGHQNEQFGYNWPFGENEGLLTIFSAIDYCGSSNNGAVAVIPKGENQDIEICTFESSYNDSLIIPPVCAIKNNITFMEINDYSLSNLLLGTIPKYADYEI